MNYKTAAEQDRVWTICAEPSDDINQAYIVTTYGAEGGKMQTHRRVVKGKNKGKKNETRALEQAVAEAEAKYKLKAQQVERAPKLPMLSQTYSGGHLITFPCFVQPKLDGIRGVYDPVSKEIYSREGNTFSHLTHILDDLDGITVHLDGELYTSDLSFEDLKGLMTRKAYAPEIRRLKFHVFDCIIKEVAFKDRLEIIRGLSFGRPNVCCVDTIECAREDVDAALESSICRGYEGIMLRNKEGFYVADKRSADLQKYKKFQDAEFVICGFKRENNSSAIVWVCQTDCGREFAAKQAGVLQARSPTDVEATKMIGKKLTVKYQELTAAGVPRFPVGICVRDYE